MTEKIDARTPRRQDAKLPEGNVQATRTYLELRQPGQFRPAFGHFPDVVIERGGHPTPALYRECHRTVGADYHWRDRRHWTHAETRPHLAQPEIALHVAPPNGTPPGRHERRRGPEHGSV